MAVDLIFFILNIQLSAQKKFNRVYTLKASNTLITDVTPLGKDGSCMSFIKLIDSASGQWEIKFVRFNGLGEIQIEKIIRHPEHLVKKLYPSIYNDAGRIHDN